MQDVTKKNSRGRPRRFDEAAARQTILDCFWDKGFAGSSLDDLSQATGMGRPSLYGAFGNKESLYLAAIQQFKPLLGRAIVEMMQIADCQQALLHFYHSALEVYFSGSCEARGCLVVCTATVEAPNSPAIREALDQTLNELDAGLSAFFRRFCEPPLAKSRARMAASILHSVAIRSRAGQPIESLRELISDAVEILKI